eukprot:16408825-Heterocapsa_arctica.AAC.1
MEQCVERFRQLYTSIEQCRREPQARPPGLTGGGMCSRSPTRAAAMTATEPRLRRLEGGRHTHDRGGSPAPGLVDFQSNPI